MKALIKVGYGCNEHCTFCHTQDERHIEGEAAEVHTKIDRAHALGHTMVVLSGGEPTIRAELMEWAAHVARLGMDFGLVTNGLVLAYPEVVEKLIKLRLRYVYMSLHGGSAPIHNRLVRSDSFDKALTAVQNLSGRGLDLTLNCVVTNQNLEHLRELVDVALPFADVTVKFSLVEPKGGAWHLFEAMVPRVADAAARVRDALDYGRSRAGEDGPGFSHGGFPLCLLDDYEGAFDDLKTHGFATMVEIGEPDFFPVDDLNKCQPDERCSGCSLRGPCPGVFRAYYDRFGSDELEPRTDGPRSNSFNYTYAGLVPQDGEPGCSLLRDGVTPWDRGRQLFVRNDSRVARFVATSRDFSDAEIAAIKHDQGQVYYDASTKSAPDDFPRDLVKLRRIELCTDCPERAGCTGMFEPVLEDLFTRDDAHVREILSELRGDILDVGCGEGPYEDLLAPMARDGVIKYVGIDPSPEHVASLRERWPWATLWCGLAEDLIGGAADQFDHIVILRSWNHLDDPKGVVWCIEEALRTGGTLTIVDNVAFGLARTQAQTERAEGSSADFEHYRNDDAAAADACVRSFGFEPIERRDVGPETSNQWLLRYRASRR